MGAAPRGTRGRAESGYFMLLTNSSLSPCLSRSCLLLGRLGKDRSRWIESPHDRPDAERQLPEELRHGRDALQRPPCLDDPEQHADPRSDDQGAADEPKHGHAPWNESGAVHQVAENQPVADA